MNPQTTPLSIYHVLNAHHFCDVVVLYGFSYFVLKVTDQIGDSIIPKFEQYCIHSLYV